MSTTDRLNILLVEDNEDDYVIVRDLLREIDPERFTLEWIHTYDEGLSAVQALRHDVILMDYRLPCHTGIELLQETQGLPGRAPVILMTGQGDREIDIQAMQSGAADYLIKDSIDADRLERAIRYAVERQRSLAAIQTSEERYRAFIQNSAEGIWRFEVSPPLSQDRPIEEQIAHLRRHARVAECNDAAARLYGFGGAADVIGMPLGDLFLLDAAGHNECLTRLVSSSYHTTVCDDFGADGFGRSFLISHTLTGILQGGSLHRIWGTLSDITERNRAESALANLAAIVASSDAVIISYTLDGIVVTWNKGAEVHYGYTAAEMIGCPVTLLIPPDRKDEMQTVFDTVRRGGSVTTFETVRVRKDRSRIDVSLAVAPIIDTGGRVIGISSVAHDISARKEAERKLRASEANMAAAQSIGHFGSWELEIDDRDDISASRLLWSDGNCAIHGMPPSCMPTLQEEIGFYPVEYRAEVTRYIEACAQDGTPYDYELPMITATGRPIWVRSVGEAVRDAEGRITRLQGSLQDITDRKRAEEALRESEQKFRRIIETALEGVIAVGADGKITYVNQRVCEMFGYTTEELISRDRFFLIAEQDLDDARRRSARRPQGVREQFDRRFRHKNGSLVWGMVSASPVIDESGRVAGTFLMITDITERKRAEEERDRFFTMSLDLMCIATQDGYFQRLNPVWAATLGHPEAELLARPYLEFVHPDDRSATVANSESLADGITITNFENRFRCRDGSYRWLSWRSVPDPATGLIYAVARDVTERRQYEQTLALRDQAILSSSNGILIADMQQPDIPTVFVNPAFERITGYAADDVLGRNCRFLQGTDTGQPELGQIRAALRAGEPVTVTLRNYRKDGTLFWNKLSLSPLRNEQGTVTHYVGIQDDITERTRAEEELLASQERFTLAVTGSRDGIWDWNIITGESYFSPRMKERMGYENHDIENHVTAWEALLHPADYGRTMEALRAHIEDHVPYDIDYRLLTKTGEYRWFRGRGQAVWDEHGRATRMAGSLSDINGLKEIEETLRNSQTDLEARVQERTLELQRAMEEAKQANAAKSEFLSRMSHELRTPMNSILGFAQIMEMDEPSEKQAVRLAHITKAGQHLLQLINEVLDIARVESGRLQMSPEPVSLSSVLRMATDWIRPLCQPRGQRIVCGWSEKDPLYVQADQQRLSQVMINLLSNAAKFNRDDGVILVQCEKRPEGRLRVSVSDSGYGIPTYQMSKLFRPFERLSAEGGPIEGTGLGLALSKRLVELMGGTISVESVVGVGSTFWVELPVAEHPVQSGVDIPLPAFRPDSEGRQHTILYIEDNDANLQVIEHVFLSRPEYQLLSATKGLQGLLLARSQRPALILLDLHLPDLPGGEVLSRLQADPLTRDIPVVILSADATPTQIRRLMAGGAAEYLTKPLDIRRFLDVLQGYTSEQIGEARN